MTSPHRWRKSSYSGQEGDCAELAHTLNAVRDSKNPGGPTLGVDVRGLLAAISVISTRRYGDLHRGRAAA
jgi:hypothetical protein